MGNCNFLVLMCLFYLIFHYTIWWKELVCSNFPDSSRRLFALMQRYFPPLFQYLSTVTVKDLWEVKADPCPILAYLQKVSTNFSGIIDKSSISLTALHFSASLSLYLLPIHPSSWQVLWAWYNELQKSRFFPKKQRFCFICFHRKGEHQIKNIF